MSSKRVRADLALLFCSLVWGGTFIVVKDALADVSIFTYLAVRFALSAAVMAILFWRTLRAIDGRTIWAGAQIGFFMFGGYAFQTTGLKFTTASKAAFITGSSVVLVPIFLAAFGRRRINVWVWLGALSALVGLYFLMIPPEGFGSLNRGDAIALGCAVMFALHVIFIGHYVERHAVGSLSFLQVATTALLATIAVPLLSSAGWEAPKLVWSGQLIFAVLITAIGSTVVGFSFQTWAQQYTTPTHTAIFISLEPVFAVLTAWIVAHERLSGRVWLGAGLILLGIVLAELKGATPIVPESPEPIVSAQL